MSNQISQRLEMLRKAVSQARADIIIIPQADPHQSEYLPEHWEIRRFFSGFTGSAGTLVVTQNKAALWTDSRYFIQASLQLEQTGIELMKDGLKATPSITQWIASNLPEGGKVAIDGWLMTANAAKEMAADLGRHGITLVTDINPVDAIWTDRPPMPKDKAFVHELKYAGETASSKIDRVMQRLASMELPAYLMTSLDDIAWTLHLRGRDSHCTTVKSAYLYLSPSETILFIDPDKVDNDVNRHLAENNVSVRPYASLPTFLRSLPEGAPVGVDFSRAAFEIVRMLAGRAVDATCPIGMFKAVKNATQVDGFRAAMRRDGAALCKAFREIESRVLTGVNTTEIDVADIIHRYRAEQPLFFSDSFDTISGYAEHGAIVHYTATEESNAAIKPESLLLVDTGAQYLDGTTDITRTVAFGDPTPQERRDFTLVLKGHIALANAIFPEGTTGMQLDTFAKQYLWRAGQTYLHGTGHGVGHFLNVHEGPQSIRSNGANYLIPLVPGMVTSNEPGLYKEGLHGIRCENLILTVETDIPGSDAFRYLAFETITLFPFDTKLIDLDIFTDDERRWLNAYHRQVADEISPLLDADTAQWLKEKTKPI